MENMVDPVRKTHQPISQLHPSWLTDEERETRTHQSVNAEASRRVTEDQLIVSQEKHLAVDPTIP